MQKSATELAILAVVDTVDAATSPEGFPKPSRNETVDSLLENLGAGDGGRINVLDGDQTEREEYAGADSGAFDGYYLTHSLTVELLIAAKEPERRDSLFDAALMLIDGKIAEDRTLGGVVDQCHVTDLQRSNLVTDGQPYMKSCLITIVLGFQSARTF